MLTSDRMPTELNLETKPMEAVQGGTTPLDLFHIISQQNSPDFRIRACQRVAQRVVAATVTCSVAGRPIPRLG